MPKKMQSPLETCLKDYITLHGPISIAQLMAEVLGHPQHGYYATRDPFGRQGDFITAPEISQIFGELIGVWCAYSWQQMGSPKGVMLVELGPGRGTLMQDALRATRHVHGFHESISVHMIETSPTLIKMQQQTLAGSHSSITWHREFRELPDAPLLVVANEFFDALPIHQYVYSNEQWHERMVALHPETGALCFTLTPSAVKLPVQAFANKAVVETSPVSEAIMRQIAEKIAQNRGAALIIDYGYTSGYGDTLQALKQHRYHPVLADLGEADMTAHVNLAALKHHAEAAGAVTYPAVTQAAFLRAMGIEARAAALAKNATPEMQQAIHNAVDRLTSSHNMGELFKVLIVTDCQHPTPAGL
jgi:NADH dehydrogenase [ubiquinone] 1 alpha subcomplex assembly factor 7